MVTFFSSPVYVISVGAGISTQAVVGAVPTIVPK
jgi:hypothetical protein